MNESLNEQSKKVKKYYNEKMKERNPQLIYNIKWINIKL